MRGFAPKERKTNAKLRELLGLKPVSLIINMDILKRFEHVSNMKIMLLCQEMHSDGGRWNIVLVCPERICKLRTNEERKSRRPRSVNSPFNNNVI